MFIACKNKEDIQTESRGSDGPSGMGAEALYIVM